MSNPSYGQKVLFKSIFKVGLSKHVNNAFFNVFYYSCLISKINTTNI